MPNLNNQLEIPQCSHCAVDKPHLNSLWTGKTDRHSGGNNRSWRAYQCMSCGGVVIAASTQDGHQIHEMYPTSIMETFEFEHLPDPVRQDFSEALTCFSYSCYNAFAAMARRTIQSMSANLGAEGKDKVTRQLTDLKEMSQIDDATFQVLEQIIIAGHDGAHPYLPALSSERAGVLLELMKDVLYQIYVRKAKVQKAMQLRKQSINEAKK